MAQALLELPRERLTFDSDFPNALAKLVALKPSEAPLKVPRLTCSLHISTQVLVRLLLLSGQSIACEGRDCLSDGLCVLGRLLNALLKQLEPANLKSLGGLQQWWLWHLGASMQSNHGEVWS